MSKDRVSEWAAQLKPGQWVEVEFTESENKMVPRGQMTLRASGVAPLTVEHVRGDRTFKAVIEYFWPWDELTDVPFDTNDDDEYPGYRGGDDDGDDDGDDYDGEHRTRRFSFPTRGH